jgi:ERCC4-type nuclease
MSQEQRNHQTAVSWIEGEIENLIRDLGKPNASAAATSSITLAFLLRVITDEEHRHFRSRIDQIYERYNTQFKGAA